MIVLGVHSGHDCGAAIVRDGEIVSAVNEERITRNKLSFGVPYRSIPEAMRLAGITIDQVDEIALETIAKPHWLTAHARPWLCKALLSKGKGLLDFFMVEGSELRYRYGLDAFLLNLLAATGLPRFLLTDLLGYFELRRIAGFGKKITFVSHHHAHLASAYFTSEFDQALSVVIEEYDGHDAFKLDLISAGSVVPFATSTYPHSPGVFYALITRILGYNQLLHAGKVTGLAAYANPADAMPLVERLMWDEGFELRLAPLVFQLTAEYARDRRIPDYFKGFSAEQLSAAFQRRLEDSICAVVERALQKTGSTNILLSGGVAANVRLNQRIFELPGVENIYIHPGMSDCGTAVGAALWAAHNRSPVKPRRLPHVFLGHEITAHETEVQLTKHALTFSTPSDMAHATAEVLAAGKIVARVCGKMEYGPRALGNRSILYHCRDVSINQWLNHRLERTEFMPFAPIVLAEYAAKCFKKFKGAEYTAEFMTITFDCTDWMREHCPAVVHLDGTARPQFVTAAGNPGMHRILSEYQRITGIPVLINTSYNIHNQPIAMSAEDAIVIFKKTALDYLALENCLVSAAENGLEWRAI